MRFDQLDLFLFAHLAADLAHGSHESLVALEWAVLCEPAQEARRALDEGAEQEGDRLGRKLIEVVGRRDGHPPQRPVR